MKMRLVPWELGVLLQFSSHTFIRRRFLAKSNSFESRRFGRPFNIKFSEDGMKGIELQSLPKTEGDEKNKLLTGGIPAKFRNFTVSQHILLNNLLFCNELLLLASVLQNLCTNTFPRRLCSLNTFLPA